MEKEAFSWIRLKVPTFSSDVFIFLGGVLSSPAGCSGWGGVSV